MSAVCRSCGVAVVPGYVRCPKCHAPIPGGGSRNRRAGGGTAVDPGGTSLESGRRFPYFLVGGGVIVVIAVVWFYSALQDYRDAGRRTVAKPTPAQPGETTPATPVAVPGTDPTTTTPPPNAPDPTAAASDFQAGLQRQRLWSTVEVFGDRVDVRSGSCGDPAMPPAVDAARDGLRSAGLTRLRCLEQSGRVVFERDL
jgi:hypothetical protein